MVATKAVTRAIIHIGYLTVAHIEINFWDPLEMIFRNSEKRIVYNSIIAK